MMASTDVLAPSSEPVVLYGPFHRLLSPTQSNWTAKQQERSNEIWGRARLRSNIPQVQAYLGPLAEDAKGIEFFTPVPPDTGTVHARWTGPREGVRIHDGFAKIAVQRFRTTQDTHSIVLVGITGPSGSGKSTLAHQNLGYDAVVVGEDPSTFVQPDFVPYAARNAATERPTHNRWGRVQQSIEKAVLEQQERKSTDSAVVIVEHFLLAFLPRVVEQLDVLIVLDDLQNETDLAQRGGVLRERRIERQSNRDQQEKEDLRVYYDAAVWPTYCAETRPALRLLADQLGEDRVLQIDPLTNSPEQILQTAMAFLQGYVKHIRT